MKALAAAIALAAMVAALAPPAAHATNPIDDPVEVPIYGEVTSDGVGRAVIAALLRRGWTPGKEGPGSIEATLSKAESYRVTIVIRYVAQHATINYVRSTGLDYDEETREIGGNYNKWMRMLAKEIGVNIALLASQPAPPVTAKVVPVLPDNQPVVQSAPAPKAPAQVTEVDPNARQELVLRAGTLMHARALPASDLVARVADDTAVTRKGPVKNVDGTWWYVTAGGKSGWVMDTDFR